MTPTDNLPFKRATLICFAAGAILTAALTGFLQLLLTIGLERIAALALAATAAFGIAAGGIALIARIDRRWRTRVEALEAGSARYRAFFDINPEPAFGLAMDGRIEAANKRATALLGHTTSELARHTLAEFVDPGRHEALSDALHQVTSGEPASLDIALIHRNGGITAVSLHAQPVRRDGKLIAIQAIAQELAQAPAIPPRNDRERNCRLLFDHSLEGILLTDPDGRIYAANSSACRLLGRSEQALQEGGWAAVLDRDDARIPAMLEARSRDRRFSGELGFRRGDGKVIPIEANITDYRDDGGREWSGVMFRDLSLRKAASDETRLLRTCLTRLNDAVLITKATPLRAPGPHIVFVNPAFERMTGFSAEEAIGATPRILQGPRTDAAALARVRSRLARGLEAREEIVNYRKSGEPYTAEMNIAPIFDDRGINTHFVSIERDVSKPRAIAEQLEEAEQRYRALFDLNPDPAYLIDLKGRFISANRKTVEFSGYTQDELLHTLFSQLVAIEDHERIFDHFRHNRRGLTQRYTVTGIHKDGTRRRIEIAATPLYVQGRIRGVFGIAKDVTDAKRTEEELRLAANALGNTGESTLITDAEWNVVSVNHAFTRISGFAREDVIGHSLPQLGTHPEGQTYYARMRQCLMQHGHWQGELRLRRKNGEDYPASASFSAVQNESGEVTHFVSVVKDISRFKQYEQRLEFLAHNDALTGLPNRVLFEKKAGEALARAERHQQVLGVLFIDLDQFKVVNDSLGHAVGDALLKLVAERLTGLVRRTDTLARPGGDEFIIILEELHHTHDAALVADSLLKELTRPFLHEGYELFTSASIGISCYPDDAQDIETLLRSADAAMYRAKELGRNTYEFFSAELNTRAHDYLFIANSLRQALERQEFTLHYQPSVDLASGRIRGAEALIRWQHPERGMIPPDQFIPIAETTGMISAIGDWVLETACRQARAWQDIGLPPIPISVNLSARQFRRPELLNSVRRLLRDTGLEASRLKLEITESMVMDQPERSSDMLKALHAMGIRIAIDDFGTGYSSLSYLKQFPVDCLKIDRSFVSGIPHNEDDAIIIRAILSLARHLKLEVIAEGVETAAQREFLRAQGCAEAQGYLFTPPLPASDFETALAHGRYVFEPATA